MKDKDNFMLYVSRMVSFNDVNDKFKEHGCILLMTEEDFNLESRKTTDKYNYTAQCGHNNEIRFNDFKSKSQGVNCPKCVNLKHSINQKEKYRLNPILKHDLEFDSIEHLKSLIGDSFDVRFNGECCLADCCIKPKNITEDKWLMVQLKTTEKQTSNRYNFDCKSNYYLNCIVMCICRSDKKMWIFDGNKMTLRCISIVLTNSQHDVFEITNNTILHDKLSYFYNTLPKYDFETTDIPINPTHKLEHEYRIYRETTITCLTFIRNERQGLVYDFKVNDYKVQEKVCSQRKNRTGISFILDKNYGSINGVKQHISYQTGDNDFYWLNVNDKKHFYIIPEHELLSRNYINTDKQSAIYLTPNAKKNSKNFWANEYLFDYTNITEIDEQRLKKMFKLCF